MKLLHWLVVGLWLVAPVSVLGQAPAPVDAVPTEAVSSDDLEDARQRILQIAHAYATHQWSATEANVHHGLDAQGFQVDTPDASYRQDGFHADGRANVGVPYMWGGFSSLDEFDQGVREGFFAGHLPQSGASPASAQAVGVDCSGFVSRCWDLPMKQSTRSIGNVAYVLEDFEDLLPGDAVNSFDGHVVVFREFTGDGNMSVYEAGGSRVQESVYPVKFLEEKGYVPIRFKPLDSRWVPMDLPAATHRLSPTGEPVFTAGAEALTLDDLWNPLDDSIVGEWTRYAFSDADSMTMTRAVMGETDDEQVLLQVLTTVDGKDQPTDGAHDRSGPLVDLLVDFAGFPIHLVDIEVSESTVASGTYRLDHWETPAHHLELTIAASLLARGNHYPVTLQVQAYLSDEVPVEGLLEVSFILAVDYGQGRRGGGQRELRLTAFHDPEQRDD